MIKYEIEGGNLPVVICYPEAGETLCTESCTMDIETIKGAKNIFLGGEGLFHTRITGPGKVYVQSMPIMKVAQAVQPYLTIGGDSGDINIKLGD